MRIVNYATPEVVTVRPHDSIDRAIALMEEHDIQHLVVVREKQVVGMLSDRDILISTGWMLGCERQAMDPASGAQFRVGPTHVSQIMSRPAVTIAAGEDVAVGARIMLERRIGALPVLEEERLVGLATETDLLNWLDQLAVRDTLADVILHREVRDLMRLSVSTVTPTSPLEDVIDLFRRRRIRHVPVVIDTELVGIISDRDVRRALGWSSVQDQKAEIAGRGESPIAAGFAADIMRTNLATLRPSTSLRIALRKMVEGRIHALPVTEADRLTGILTQTDYLRMIAREGVL